VKVFCGPCQKKVCPLDHAADRATPAMVYDAAMQLSARPRRARHSPLCRNHARFTPTSRCRPPNAGRCRVPQGSPDCFIRVIRVQGHDRHLPRDLHAQEPLACGLSTISPAPPCWSWLRRAILLTNLYRTARRRRLHLFTHADLELDTFPPPAIPPSSVPPSKPTDSNGASIRFSARRESRSTLRPAANRR